MAKSYLELNYFSLIISSSLFMFLKEGDRMKHFGKLAVISLAVLSAACGGGGGGGGSSSTVTAQFIDAPVNGIDVLFGDATSPTKTEVTSNRGNFPCVIGESLFFKLKGLEIGRGACGEKIFLSEVSPAPEKASQLILTLAGLDDSGVTGLADNAVLSITSETVSLGITDIVNQAVPTTISIGSQPSVSVVSSGVATSHINRFISLNSSVSSELRSALNTTVLADGGYVKFVGTARAGGVDCYTNFIATALIERSGSAETGVFSITPDHVGFFEAENPVLLSTTPGVLECTNQMNGDTCFTEDVGTIGKKLITGSTFRISKYEEEAFPVNKAFQYDQRPEWLKVTFAAVEKTSINFNVSFSNDAFSGTFSDVGSYLSDPINQDDVTAGQTEGNPYIFNSMTNYSCTYDIQAYSLNETVPFTR